MSGYIEAGYSVVLGTLAVYAGVLVRRERRARRRLGTPGPWAPGPDETVVTVPAPVEACGEPDVAP